MQTAWIELRSRDTSREREQRPQSSLMTLIADGLGPYCGSHIETEDKISKMALDTKQLLTS
jgi:hypothetical protein